MLEYRVEQINEYPEDVTMVLGKTLGEFAKGGWRLVAAPSPTGMAGGKVHIILFLERETV